MICTLLHFIKRVFYQCIEST